MPLPRTSVGLTNSSLASSNGSSTSAVLALSSVPLASIFRQNHPGSAPRQKERDTTVPADMPRRLLRRKSGLVPHNLTHSSGAPGPSTGVEMAQKKAIPRHPRATPLEEGLEPSSYTLQHLLSNASAEAPDLDSETGDFLGGHAPDLKARNNCTRGSDIGIRPENAGHDKGRIKNVLGKRDRNASEAEDSSWRRSR